MRVTTLCIIREGDGAGGGAFKLFFGPQKPDFPALNSFFPDFFPFF